MNDKIKSAITNADGAACLLLSRVKVLTESNCTDEEAHAAATMIEACESFVSALIDYKESVK